MKRKTKIELAIAFFKKISQGRAKPEKRETLEERAENFRYFAENPFQNPPPYEKLAGDLEGAYSRRINIQHRVIYQVNKKEKQVRILRMWTHYE